MHIKGIYQSPIVGSPILLLPLLTMIIIATVAVVAVYCSLKYLHISNSQIRALIEIWRNGSVVDSRRVDFIIITNNCTFRLCGGIVSVY